MDQTFFQKYGKKIILAVIVVAAVIAGLSRLNIQSVSDYEKERNGLQSELHMETVSGGAADDTQVTDASPSAVTASAEVSESPSASKRPDTKKKTSGPQTADSKKAEKSKNSGSSSKTEKNTSKAAASDGHSSKKRSNSHTGQKKEKQTKNSSAPAVTKSSNSSGDGKITCTIEIRCDALSRKRESLSSELRDLVPADGILLARSRITVKKGTSVYNVLTDVCKASKIQLDAEYTPVYGTYYVKSIAHLYEMAAGDMSGWLYFVNGVKPDVGSSDYKVSDGDAIRWSYTCDGETAQ